VKSHITVRVHPRAPKQSLENTGDGIYRVSVRSSPEDGRANAEVIELLSKHLGVPRSCFRIVRGAKARVKLIAIDAP
jgi:uncharacterized protein YggU (UPF0235/DUF167 family)